MPDFDFLIEESEFQPQEYVAVTPTGYGYEQRHALTNKIYGTYSLKLSAMTATEYARFLAFYKAKVGPRTSFTFQHDLTGSQELTVRFVVGDMVPKRIGGLFVVYVSLHLLEGLV